MTVRIKIAAKYTTIMKKENDDKINKSERIKNLWIYFKYHIL